MELYTLLRAFADSWFLVLMFAFFVGAIIWAMRPGSRAVYRDISSIPFRHDDRPAKDGQVNQVKEARP